MTDGTTTAPPAPAPASGSQRRKPRRKRNTGKKNDSGTQQKGGKGGASKSVNKKSASGGNNNGPPPPPQIKITIRNIRNSEKFGTVKSVLEVLVSKLMEDCVEKKANNQYSIEMDRMAVRYLITEEEKIKERREQIERDKARLMEEKQAKIESETKNSNKNAENTAVKSVDGDEKDKIEEGKAEKLGDEPSTVTKDTPDDDNKLDVILASKTPSKLPTINARPLYVVPPRKTRRRGERGGTAYVLLIGPKIEKKNPITTIAKEGEKKDSLSTSQGYSEEQKPTAVSDPADGSKQTPETSPEEKTINYPQELAKGRLLLSNALKALTELTSDAKAEEFIFSGCIVEQSMNGKTWKVFQNNTSRPDRREGTIENTADYKEWMETVAKQKEELKARPKPVPGGGVIATTTASTTANGDELEEDGQLVSSLVQHLRAKKLEAKRKKSQKKKKKEESNKANVNSNSGSNSKGDAAAGASGNEKKKKKRNEKKNKNNAANGVKSDAAATAAATKKAKRKKKERLKKKEKAKAAANAAAGSKAPTAAAAGSKAPTTVLKPQLSST